MHTHTVFFWLRNDVNIEGRAAFQNGLDRLTREPHVLERRIGAPAQTRRDVVDSTFDYAIVLKFADLGAHDAYQVSEAHQGFLDDCLGMIDRVQVYDVAH